MFNVFLPNYVDDDDYVATCTIYFTIMRRWSGFFFIEIMFFTFSCLCELTLKFNYALCATVRVIVMLLLYDNVKESLFFV